MTRFRLMLVMVLTLAVILSATGVVYAKYTSRKHFLELQEMHSERDRLDVQWGRLQLEQSTWATHGRIERTARKQLKMYMPSADEVVVIRLEQ